LGRRGPRRKNAALLSEPIERSIHSRFGDEERLHSVKPPLRQFKIVDRAGEISADTGQQAGHEHVRGD
jgi:hypothetical protein